MSFSFHNEAFLGLLCNKKFFRFEIVTIYLGEKLVLVGSRFDGSSTRVKQYNWATSIDVTKRGED